MFDHVNTSGTEQRKLPVRCSTLEEATTVQNAEVRFIYCLRLNRIAACFCCEFLPLRKGLVILSIIEFAMAFLGAVYLVVNGVTANVCYSIVMFLRLLDLASGYCCIRAARMESARAATIVYHWKIWETLITGILNLAGMMESIANLSRFSKLTDFVLLILSTTFVLLAFTCYGIFTAYIAFSYRQLVLTNNQNLANYGPEVLNMMIRIRNQAEVMDMQPIDGIKENRGALGKQS
eukprot:TRINITY_DN1595_c0_g1_i11.p1 TRINITY_DN1595_c0_g1~~TRINITY_DN1595_c0_g1_i11.p1  ORF type:complete len:235 (+),score=43.02 TRINITY_DN1595_c0_g1_i11:227-931(+)